MTYYPTPLPATLAALPAGVAGIRATLKHMVRFARKYKTDIGIRTLAVKIRNDAGVKSKDYGGEAVAVFNWVKKHIKYVRDVDGVETLQTPKATLQMEAGDCDDHATLIAALLASIGHPVRFVALDFGNGQGFSHVIVQTKVGEAWITLDTTVSYARAGWNPPGALEKMIMRV